MFKNVTMENIHLPLHVEGFGEGAVVFSEIHSQNCYILGKDVDCVSENLLVCTGILVSTCSEFFGVKVDWGASPASNVWFAIVYFEIFL